MARTSVGDWKPDPKVLVRSKYLITVVSILVAAAASVLMRKLLKSHVSEPLSQGAGMYVMWLCLYFAIKSWSHKPEATSSEEKRQLTFWGWAVMGLLPAVMVTTAYIYFP
jgi:hypothetical protein